jgi:hypothetical protein
MPWQIADELLLVETERGYLPISEDGMAFPSLEAARKFLLARRRVR